MPLFIQIKDFIEVFVFNKMFLLSNLFQEVITIIIVIILYYFIEYRYIIL